jgi:hypothetical protein
MDLRFVIEKSMKNKKNRSTQQKMKTSFALQINSQQPTNKQTYKKSSSSVHRVKSRRKAESSLFFLVVGALGLFEILTLMIGRDVTMKFLLLLLLLREIQVCAPRNILLEIDVCCCLSYVFANVIGLYDCASFVDSASTSQHATHRENKKQCCATCF